MFNFSRRKPTLCISMQYFADPETAETDASAGAETKAAAEDTADKEPTFDDVLKNKAYQSEFDKRINKALDTEKQKWEAGAKAQADEAAKLAKMKADEKTEYERQKREKELSDREAAML